MDGQFRLSMEPQRGSIPGRYQFTEEWVNVHEDGNDGARSTINDLADTPRTIETQTGVTEVGSHGSTRSSHSVEQERIQIALHGIAHKYEISWDMAVRLVALRNYEIVIVCDDSGSMITPIDDTGKTRWDALCYIVKIILEIGVIFDSNGVDIHFLNADPILNVKDPARVNGIFSREPSGFTPLASTLQRIFQSPLSRRGNDKKLLVFVATDGASTDAQGKENPAEFEHVMLQQRQRDTTFVSFLPCTDDSQYLDCLKGWDRTMIHVDVTDRFLREREQIRQCRGANFAFAMGDYVVKALIGAIDREIDRWNEP